MAGLTSALLGCGFGFVKNHVEDGNNKVGLGYP